VRLVPLLFLENETTNGSLLPVLPLLLFLPMLLLVASGRRAVAPL